MSSTNITNEIKRSLSFLDNPYVAGTLTLIIILYASLAAPKLPPQIARLFGSNLVRFLFCFLIVYFCIKSVPIAIVLSIALIVSIQTYNKMSLEEQLRQWTTLSSTDDSRSQLIMAPRNGSSNNTDGLSGLSLTERNGSQMINHPMPMNDQNNNVSMPSDSGFETTAMPSSLNNEESGIMGSDPDADNYGSAI